MSFGFGVGDLLAVIRLANDIRKEFSGAPEQLQNIASDVRSLGGILQDVDIYLAGHDITPNQEETLAEIEQNCQKVLQDIQSFVEKNSGLQTGKSGKRERIKRVWLKARWDSDDTRDLRQRLTSNLVLLNAFSSSITSDNVTKLVMRQTEQQNENILEWLLPATGADQHANFVSDRISGTGQWLIDSSEYQTWLQTKGRGALFLHGIPGAGKTMLTSKVIDELHKQCQTDESIGLCYLYCDYKRQNEQTMENVVLRLLSQLARLPSVFPLSIQNLHDRCRKAGIRPSLADIKSELISIVKSFALVYIIVDALDECQTTNNNQSKLIEMLKDLQQVGTTNIMVTSRPIPNIQAQFSTFTPLEILAQHDDIGRYIQENLKNLPKFVANNSELQQEIVSAVTTKVDGMFLLAKLYIDSMKGKKSATQLRKALKSLNTGTNPYQEAYSKTMEGIKGQVGEQAALAMEVLAWIVYARESLTANQLLLALSVEDGASAFDMDNITDLDDALSACGGLVVVETESDVVRLVHYTTQEFFKSDDGGLWLEEAQSLLANKCITYLCFDKAGKKSAISVLTSRLPGAYHGFHRYMCENWGYHARDGGEMDPVRDFVKKESEYHEAVSALLAFQEPWFDRSGKSAGDFQRLEKSMTTISLFAFFGIQDLLQEYLTEDALNQRDENLRTPMWYAATNGQSSVVQLLLGRGAKCNIPDKFGYTALEQAAKKGHESVVTILLRDKPAVDDYLIVKALPLAAERGHDATLKLLLQHLSDIHRYIPECGRALRHAARYGHDNIIQILMTAGTPVDTRSRRGRTPLILAVTWLNAYVTIVLLKNGADINARDEDGRTALMNVAARSPASPILSSLLNSGADTTISDNNGRTALMYASKDSGAHSLRVLIDHGADISVRDNAGWTALHLAAFNGAYRSVSLLLDREIDITVKTDSGATALDMAVGKNFDKIADLLREAYRSRNLEIEETGLCPDVDEFRQQRPIYSDDDD